MRLFKALFVFAAIGIAAIDHLQLGAEGAFAEPLHLRRRSAQQAGARRCQDHRHAEGQTPDPSIMTARASPQSHLPHES